ncbi:MAG TPA: hypothetical protein VIL65_00730 [Beijerinckiaceae bacterium]|jgi:O-antigen/teichoic acid export membrane protein
MTPVAAVEARSRPFLRARLRGLTLHLWTSAWVWSTALQALGSGMSLVTSVVAARLLGVAGFGAYVLVHAGVVLLSTLQYQLVAGPMVVMTGHRTRSGAYFGAVARAAAWVAGLIGVTVALYSAAVVGPAGHQAVALPLAAAVFAVGFVVHDNAKRLAFATGRPRAAFFSECARHLLFALGLAAAWFAWKVDVSVLLTCGGLGAIIAALPLLLEPLRVKPAARVWRAARQHHWVQGRWLVLMVLVSTVHEQLATILAGSMLGEDAAAGLRAAQILLGPLLVLMMSLEYIVPRRAGEHLRAGGETALVAYLLRLLMLIEVPIIVVCAGVWIYGADLMRLLLGQDYARFAPIAAIIALGPPITLAREFGMVFLRATRRTRGIFAAFAASAVITLLASYPLITTFGLTGVASMVILGHLISTVLILGFSLRAARAR